MENTFRINTPNIVHEMIDNEVVIVNLDSGRYYSIDKTGADIWHLLGNQYEEKQIIAWVSSQYAYDSDKIESSVKTFLGELVQEQLIVQEQSQSMNLPGLPPVDSNPRPFTEPKLQKYTDMEELLLLDPIHEVDDTGWPNAN